MTAHGAEIALLIGLLGFAGMVAAMLAERRRRTESIDLDQPIDSDDLGVRLTIVTDAGEAEIVCGMLRVEGIRCSYRVTDLSASAEGVGMFAGWREILVQEPDVERAREFLAAAEIGGSEAPSRR